MITSNSTGNAMDSNAAKEEVEHGLGAVVVVRADASDEAGLAINEAVNDDLESDQTCKTDKYHGRFADEGLAYRAGRRGAKES